MLTEVFTKLIDKLVASITTPEDLVLMTLLFGLGIMTTRWLPKYWNKQKRLDSEKEVCPLTGKKPKCEDIPALLSEIKEIQEEIQEVNVRVCKIMNILSKEYEGQWDRYLYDNDMSPNSVRTRKK